MCPTGVRPRVRSQLTAPLRRDSARRLEGPLAHPLVAMVGEHAERVPAGRMRAGPPYERGGRAAASRSGCGSGVPYSGGTTQRRRESREGEVRRAEALARTGTGGRRPAARRRSRTPATPPPRPRTSIPGRISSTAADEPAGQRPPPAHQASSHAGTPWLLKPSASSRWASMWTYIRRRPLGPSPSSKRRQSRRRPGAHRLRGKQAILGRRARVHPHEDLGGLADRALRRHQHRHRLPAPGAAGRQTVDPLHVALLAILSPARSSAHRAFSQ